jgi:GTPase
MTSLASVPRRVVGDTGEHGKGTWQHGKNASPVVIHVPVGTIVRQLSAGDSRRAKDEWEAEEESLEALDLEMRREKKRERRWVHYPGAAEDNLQRDAFKQAEMQAYRLEKELRWERRQRRAAEPIMLDLDKIEEHIVDKNAPLAQGRKDNLGHLLATGGAGGQGNPSFLTLANRSPKFATRGGEGERLTFALELKLLADVGLVGMPNAGKSTLLRAFTGGRVKSEVASYAFTTLNPVVGVVRVAADGTFEGGLQEGLVIDETAVEKERALSAAKAGAYIPPRMRKTGKAITSSSGADIIAEAQEHLEQEMEEDEDALIGTGYHFDSIETFRFTIADNPGLIAQSSENVGLGHSFLRSMERSLALVYVVDLSGPAPWEELRILREELDAYQPGMSKRARLVIANKADLLAPEGAEEDGVVPKEEREKQVEQARAKLAYLQQYVREHMQTPLDDGTIRPLDVVATSAKYSQNLKKVVGLMQKYVEDARYAQEQEDGVNRVTAEPRVLVEEP